MTDRSEVRISRELRDVTELKNGAPNDISNIGNAPSFGRS